MNCPLLQRSPQYCTLFLTAFLSGPPGGPVGLDERHPQNNSMPKIMLEKWLYAQLILAVFDALFHPSRHEYNVLLHQLQISNYDQERISLAMINRQLVSLRSLKK